MRWKAALDTRRLEVGALVLLLGVPRLARSSRMPLQKSKAVKSDGWRPIRQRPTLKKSFAILFPALGARAEILRSNSARNAERIRKARNPVPPLWVGSWRAIETRVGVFGKVGVRLSRLGVRVPV